MIALAMILVFLFLRAATFASPRPLSPPLSPSTTFSPIRIRIMVLMISPPHSNSTTWKLLYLSRHLIRTTTNLAALPPKVLVFLPALFFFTIMMHLASSNYHHAVMHLSRTMALCSIPTFECIVFTSVSLPSLSRRNLSFEV